MAFEWDEKKAASNLRKHGVTFDEATTVFDDRDVLIEEDAARAGRGCAIGYSAADRVLYAVYVEVDGDVVRLISARPATKRERKRYEEKRI